MNNKEKVDKLFLVDKPKVFVERQLYKARRRAKINKSLFIYLNIISMFATLVILAITTIVISKVFSKEIPSWYFYATTVASAIITLITSLINFFLVKDNAQKYSAQVKYIEGEIIKFDKKTDVYKNAKDPEMEIFHRVALLMKYDVAKEVQDERTK